MPLSQPLEHLLGDALSRVADEPYARANERLAIGDGRRGDEALGHDAVSQLFVVVGVLEDDDFA